MRLLDRQNGEVKINTVLLTCDDMALEHKAMKYEHYSDNAKLTSVPQSSTVLQSAREADYDDDDENDAKYDA